MQDLTSETRPKTYSYSVTTAGETFKFPQWAHFIDVYLDDTADGTFAVNGGAAIPLTAGTYVRIYERPEGFNDDTVEVSIGLDAASTGATLGIMLQ